jgi:hypothetical protein
MVSSSVPAGLSTFPSPLPFPTMWPTFIASRSLLNTLSVACVFVSSSNPGYLSRAFPYLFALASVRYPAPSCLVINPCSRLLASSHSLSLLPLRMLVSLLLVVCWSSNLVSSVSQLLCFFWSGLFSMLVLALLLQFLYGIHCYMHLLRLYHVLSNGRGVYSIFVLFLCVVVWMLLRVVFMYV